MGMLDTSVQTANEQMQRGLKYANHSDFKPFVNLIKEDYNEKRRGPISDNYIATVATALRNTKGWAIQEATKSGDVSHFQRYGFKMLTALLPNLIAEELVSFQPMDRRVGQVYFLDFVAGSDSGRNIKKGQSLLDTQAGPSGITNFSNETIDEEEVEEGDGTQVTFEKYLSESYVRTNSLRIVADGMVVEDDGTGNLVGDVDPGGENYVEYSNGHFKVTFESAPATGEFVLATYETDWEYNRDGIPQLDARLRSLFIRAKTRKLRTRYLMDAAYDLQMAQGRSMEDDLLQAMVSLVRWEIDGEIMGDLLRLGGKTNRQGGRFIWDAQSPVHIPQNIYNRDIINLFVDSSNEINHQTRRGEGNFIVVGTGVSSVIEGLASDIFERETDYADGSLVGPKRIGRLNNMWDVYKNPYFPPDRGVVGFKGDQYLNMGYAYTPYLPMFTTPTKIGDTFEYQRGVATSYGTRPINDAFYESFRVVNLPGSQYWG